MQAYVLPFLDISQVLSYRWTSIHLYLCCRTAQDQEARAPNLHRAVLSCHCNVRQQQSWKSKHFPSTGKSIALAPKPFAMKHLTVCLCWKWLLNQLLQECIYMWRAPVPSQPACPFKRSRLVRIKFPSPFTNSIMLFLSISFSHLHSQKLQKHQNTLPTLN